MLPRLLSLMLIALSVLFGCQETSQEDTVPETPCTGLRPGDVCENPDPSLSRFWASFKAGDYESIDTNVEALKAVLAENPNDLAAHKAIGFLRSWQLGEMYRGEELRLETIIQGLDEASFHLGEALTAGQDPRIIIFKSTNEYMSAKQIGNAEQEAVAKEAFISVIDTWTELNAFVGGTMLSIFSQPGDPDFEMALDYMWMSVDLCAGETVDRENPLPQLSEKVKDVRREGYARACSNSFLAPHGFEGFWMFFGDLLTKAGQLDVARDMYEFTKTAQNYEAWPYRHILEARLDEIELNQDNFRLPVSQQDPKYHPIAEWSCTVCHQTP